MENFFCYRKRKADEKSHDESKNKVQKEWDKNYEVVNYYS